MVSRDAGAQIGNYLKEAEKFFDSVIDADNDIITAFKHRMTPLKKRLLKDMKYKKYAYEHPFSVLCIYIVNTVISII